MRTEREMRRVLKRLRKLWLKYPSMGLYDLVDSATEVRGDRNFIETLELYWSARARQKRRLGRERSVE